MRRHGKYLMGHVRHVLISRGRARGNILLLRCMQTRGLLPKWLLNGLDGQDHRKGAALPWRAFELYPSSQQGRQLAHDGQAQSRSPDFSCVTPICLVKGFKDTFLKIWRDANSAIL